MSDKYDPLEPLELLPDAVEGYCDLETGECVTPPRPADKVGDSRPAACRCAQSGQFG
jgi:hypothetical protein